MKNLVTVIALTIILFPLEALAACRLNEVEGDWTIFFIDSSISNKHVKVNTELHVEYTGDNYAVTLKNSNDWKVKEKSVDYICYNNGDVTVTATIEKAECEHKLSLYRVSDFSDLRSRSDGTKKLDQIEFDQYRHEGDCVDHKSDPDVANVDGAKPYVYAEVHEDDIHPGHIHGDKD